jgi:hypothetical protein
MASVGKVKHAPKNSVWIWLRNLEKWKVGRIRGWKREFVNGGNYTSIGDRPFKVARGLATYDTRRTAAMSRIRGGGLDCGIIGTWGEKLGNAKVALGRGRQKVVLRILQTEHERGKRMT